MYARVRAYQIQPGQIEERIRHVREVVIPAVQQRPGYRGTLVLLDRAGHKNLTVGLWESEADVPTSQQDPALDALLSHSRYAVGEVTTEFFEVAHHELAPPVPGAEHAEVALATRFTVQPGRLDELLRFAAERTRPAARQMPGWQGVLLLADRASERTLTISLWRSAADREAGIAGHEELRPHRHFAAGAVTQEQLEVAHHERR